MDLNAKPAAPTSANNLAQNPATTAPIAPSPTPTSTQKAETKTPKTISRNSKDVTQSKQKGKAKLKSAGQSSRLQIRATRKGSQESWTVTTSAKPATKGSKQTSFRVRVSDVGYRVCLVYYDDLGKRREPYLCYLNAKEWRQAKRGSLVYFAKLVADKLAERAEKENADSEKLGELSRKVGHFL